MQTSLEESFQHLNVLCLPKLSTFLSVGKFMHSYYYKNLLWNHLDYFFQIRSIHSYLTRLLSISETTGFCLESALFQKMFFCICWPKSAVFNTRLY